MEAGDNFRTPLPVSCTLPFNETPSTLGRLVAFIVKY
jgi:hypothetical protein